MLAGAAVPEPAYGCRLSGARMHSPGGLHERRVRAVWVYAAPGPVPNIRRHLEAAEWCQ